MKALQFSPIFSILLVFVFISCSSGDDDGKSGSGNDLIAAIAEACSTNINYEDDQENVYAYRADNIFGQVSIQAGGHSTENESTDLGVNIFGADPIFSLPNTSTYTVDEGGLIPGSGYVFYFDGSGDEFISTSNNEGALIRLESLTLTEAGAVEQLRITFDNIEVANTSDPDDKRCISAFDLKVDLGI